MTTNHLGVATTDEGLRLPIPAHAKTLDRWSFLSWNGTRWVKQYRDGEVLSEHRTLAEFVAMDSPEWDDAEVAQVLALKEAK
jgi:hypothetical protein